MKNKTSLNEILYVNKCYVLVQVLLLHNLIYISCLVKQHTAIYYCFCMKRITLCICMCSSPSSPFSSCSIQNIGKFRAKKYFIGHRTANVIPLFIPIKRKFFVSLFLRTNRREGEFPRSYWINTATLYFHNIKWTLSSGQKPAYTVKITVYPLL